jgi:hypothetical protein
VMILLLMVMMMMMMMMMTTTLTDGYINRLCRQNAEFSVVNLAVNVLDCWSTTMVMVRNFEVTVWTGEYSSLDRGQVSLYFEIGGKIQNNSISWKWESGS